MSHLAILVLGFLTYGYCYRMPQPPVPVNYYREYLGCFYLNRSLIYLQYHSEHYKGMTVQMCASDCNNSYTDYIGLSNASICDCGGPLVLDKLTKKPDDDCDIGCIGNSSQVCGAENRWSFYRMCPPFTFGFGDNCENHCHCGEESTACSPFDGKCRDGDGCESGYTGWPMCQSACHCAPGASCNNGECEDSKGEICGIGYRGWPQCQEACGQGTFGGNCEGQCHCASGASCDKVNGDCDDSKGGICGIGYSGWPQCQQEECDGQHYGQNCQHECHCAEGVSCDNKIGKCNEESVVRSCAPGWTNYPNCDEVCPSSCKDTCHPITGTCGSSTSTKLSGPVIIVYMALLITIAL